MSNIWTQGIAFDGAVFLRNGEMKTIDDIVSTLNHYEDIMTIVTSTAKYHGVLEPNEFSREIEKIFNVAIEENPLD